MNTVRHSGRPVRTLRTILPVALLLVVAAASYAQQAEVVYFQGTANLKTSGGKSIPVDFGTTMNAGDSVITGSDGVVQLDQTSGSQITVQANSVFTLQKRYQDSEQQTVMTTVLGAVSYRFAKLAGNREPAIATMSSVAGIRGTVFTVYAGSDGTSRYEVEEGMVQVSSAGQSVDLTQNQAVEVAAGGPPGKVERLSGKLDFSAWNAQKEDNIVQDPVVSLDAVNRQLDHILAELKHIEPLFEELSSDLKAADEHMKELVKQGKKDQIQQYHDEIIQPLQVKANSAALTMRYWALSALSLRQYVMGRIYLLTTLSHIKNLSDPTYQAFLERFKAMDTKFRAAVMRRLVPLDI